MRSLTDRLAALERAAPHTGASHWIIGDEGETAEQARARYELESGPIAKGDTVITWVCISPGDPGVPRPISNGAYCRDITETATLSPASPR